MLPKNKMNVNWSKIKLEKKKKLIASISHFHWVYILDITYILDISIAS